MYSEIIFKKKPIKIKLERVCKKFRPKNYLISSCMLLKNKYSIDSDNLFKNHSTEQRIKMFKIKFFQKLACFQNFGIAFLENKNNDLIFKNFFDKEILENSKIKTLWQKKQDNRFEISNFKKKNEVVKRKKNLFLCKTELKSKDNKIYLSYINLYRVYDIFSG